MTDIRPDEEAAIAGAEIEPLSQRPDIESEGDHSAAFADAVAKSQAQTNLYNDAKPPSGKGIGNAPESGY